MCDREESRPMEHALRVVSKPMLSMFPTVMTTPCSTLAKAMVNDVVAGNPEKVVILNNKDIFVMAGEIKGKNEKK